MVVCAWVSEEDGHGADVVALDAAEVGDSGCGYALNLDAEDCGWVHEGIACAVEGGCCLGGDGEGTDQDRCEEEAEPASGVRWRTNAQLKFGVGSKAAPQLSIW